MLHSSPIFCLVLHKSIFIPLEVVAICRSALNLKRKRNELEIVWTGGGGEVILIACCSQH